MDEKPSKKRKERAKDADVKRRKIWAFIVRKEIPKVSLGLRGYHMYNLLEYVFYIWILLILEYTFYTQTCKGHGKFR